MDVAGFISYLLCVDDGLRVDFANHPISCRSRRYWSTIRRFWRGLCRRRRLCNTSPRHCVGCLGHCAHRLVDLATEHLADRRSEECLWETSNLVGDTLADEEYGQILTEVVAIVDEQIIRFWRVDVFKGFDVFLDHVEWQVCLT